MKILLSWSSGKDSAWALHILRQTCPGAVAALLTTMNDEVDRVSMHGVRREVLEAQAAAVGLPLRVVRIPHPCPNEIYEAQLRDAVESAVEDDFTHLASGDLFLDDVRRYREQQLVGTGLAPLFPLWGSPTDMLAAQMVNSGLKARLSCVDTRLLDAAFVGREFDRALLDELPPGIDPCGEKGEFHSCVYAGPMFTRPIPIVTGITVTRDPFVWADFRLNLALEQVG